MNKSDLKNLRTYAGDLSGLYGIFDITHNDGYAKGSRSFLVKNGSGLELMIAADRCLDIPYASYQGKNLGLVNKVGLRAPWFYQENGEIGFRRQFNGGLLTTCGIAYSGAPAVIDGRNYPLHGSISNTPASKISYGEYQNEQGDIILFVQGELREACQFGEYLVLNRKIEIETENNRIWIHDQVRNLGTKDSRVMNLYHINFGFPLLDENARIFTSAKKVFPGGAYSYAELERHSYSEAPSNDAEELCFAHLGGTGIQTAMISNEKLELGIAVEYNPTQLPVLCQWKSMRSGDYAMGLEPSVCGCWGVEKAEQMQWMRLLSPGECINFDLRLDILTNAEQIKSKKASCIEKNAKKNQFNNYWDQTI